MNAPAPTRLARKLGTSDAVVIGLGAMLGAGVFSAIGPAAGAAGNALLGGLLIAGAVAFCNATSSAQLAARHPEAGGTYAFGRHRLGHAWGFLAGWAFLTGKLASGAAMALTVGRHVAPGWERPIAVATVLGLTAVNYFGVTKTVAATRHVVRLVIAALLIVVTAAWAGGGADAARLVPTAVSPRPVLEAAGFLFFAFAGYARITTLGEEVVDPRRTIPRAVPIALGAALVIYFVVAATALAVLPPDVLAASPAPLAAVVAAGRFPELSIIPRAGAAVASVGVLLSLVAGMSRTAFAMADAGDLPRALAAVHPRYRVPHRAEVVVGALVAGLAATVDLRGAIGFSSFNVLVYYAITNAAALRLRADERLWPRALAVAGGVGCLVVAVSLPTAAVAGGAGVLAVGALIFAARRWLSARGGEGRRG